MMRHLLLAAFLALPGLAAAQPSFDCARARAWDERAICAQADLSELDRRIAAAWRTVTERAPAEERARLQGEQRAWLAERRACQGPVEREAQSCLRRMLRARARDLEAVAAAGAAAAAKPPPAQAPAAPQAEAPLRAVACPATAGWAARTICATPGMRELDAAIVRDVATARSRAAGQANTLAEIAAFVTRHLAEREACARAPGRLPVDCLQETMEQAQAALRRHLGQG
jgi:uncharacterized protein